MVAQCQDTIDNPDNYTYYGGAPEGGYNQIDAGTWPLAAVACAFAYRVTGDSKYVAPAIKFWVASLEDDNQVAAGVGVNTIGNGLGCVSGVDTNWQAWVTAGSPYTNRPAVLLPILGDTGYVMRWHGMARRARL